MKEEKWLLVISFQLYPCSVGGVEVFNYYLIKQLSEKYNLHLLTDCKVDQFDNIVTHTMRKLPVSKITRPLQILFFLFKNRKNIKITYMSYSRAFWSYWYVYYLANKFFNVQYFFTIHGGGLTKWKPKLPYLLYFKKAKSITGVSKRIIDEYKRRLDRNIIYTPPLVPYKIIDDEEQKIELRTKWNIKQESTVILYVGSLKKLKRVDTLIDSVNILPKEIRTKKKLLVLICGDGNMKDELVDKVNSYSLQGTIRFLGNIERNTIHELYSICDIYTICSEFEGLPISLLEAFANNKPSVTSDAPGLIEVSENNKNSLLFKKGDSIDYSLKLQALISNESLKNILKANALNFYESNFSYTKLIDEFQKIIDDE